MKNRKLISLNGDGFMKHGKNEGLVDDETKFHEYFRMSHSSFNVRMPPEFAVVHISAAFGAVHIRVNT
jgi:hypothetical protein